MKVTDTLTLPLQLVSRCTVKSPVDISTFGGRSNNVDEVISIQISTVYKIQHHMVRDEEAACALLSSLPLTVTPYLHLSRVAGHAHIWLMLLVLQEVTSH